MANTKSSIKSIRKTEARTARNVQVRSRLKTLSKKARQAAGGEDAEAAKAAARLYISALDKASKRGIVHRNRADSAKAKLSAALS